MNNIPQDTVPGPDSSFSLLLSLHPFLFQACSFPTSLLTLPNVQGTFHVLLSTQNDQTSLP